jgi:hypothetical protein
MDRVSGKSVMLRRIRSLLIVCLFAGSLHAQDLAGVEIHGFATQGFLFAQFEKGKFYFAGEYRRSPVNPIATFGRAVVPIPVDTRS